MTAPTEQPEQLETICATHLDVEVGGNGTCETARLIRVVGEPSDSACVPAVLVPVEQYEDRTDRHCAKHGRWVGSEVDTCYQGAVTNQSCDVRVLVPVTQRQVEQRVIEAGKQACSNDRDESLEGQRALRKAVRELAAVQGIPDTHTVDVNVPPISTDATRLCGGCEEAPAVTEGGLCELCSKVLSRINGKPIGGTFRQVFPVDTEAGNG